MKASQQPDIAPSILCRHPGLDDQQRAIIAHGDGPLLVVAGPGSGKTLCIELRAVNLVLLGSISPQDLWITAFAKSAALELRNRFQASACAAGYSRDVSAAEIHTTHGLCHRLVRPYAGDLGLRPGYQILDQSHQSALMRQQFDVIFGPDVGVLNQRGWANDHDIIKQGAAYFDRIAEEGVEIAEMEASPTPFDAALARCCRRYRQTLRENNLIDFSGLLALADALLDDDQIAGELGGRIGYLMVDEAQDTSYIQDRILRRLAEVNRNIALVGDDDQAIYGFRGASVENMLSFPLRYPDARVLELTTNYRSHSAIVQANHHWMAAANWRDPEGNTSFRHDKKIVASDCMEHAEYPAVMKVQGSSTYDEGRRLGGLFRFLRTQGVIARFGQCALLLHSVGPAVSGPYIYGLEDAGVPVKCVPAGSDEAARESRRPDEVVVTTIHQSKGKEWDVVGVGSLSFHGGDPDPVGRRLAGYLPPDSPRQNPSLAEHTRMRQHYVAFSRARRLLILTASDPPHQRFDTIWRMAPQWPGPDLDVVSLARQRFGDDPTPGVELVFHLRRVARLIVRVGPPWSSEP